MVCACCGAPNGVNRSRCVRCGAVLGPHVGVGTDRGPHVGVGTDRGPHVGVGTDRGPHVGVGTDRGPHAAARRRVPAGESKRSVGMEGSPHTRRRRPAGAITEVESRPRFPAETTHIDPEPRFPEAVGHPRPSEADWGDLVMGGRTDLEVEPLRSPWSPETTNPVRRASPDARLGPTGHGSSSYRAREHGPRREEPEAPRNLEFPDSERRLTPSPARYEQLRAAPELSTLEDPMLAKSWREVAEALAPAEDPVPTLTGGANDSAFDARDTLALKADQLDLIGDLAAPLGPTEAVRSTPQAQPGLGSALSAVKGGSKPGRPQPHWDGSEETFAAPGELAGFVQRDVRPETGPVPRRMPPFRGQESTDAGRKANPTGSPGRPSSPRIGREARRSLDHRTPLEIATRDEVDATRPLPELKAPRAPYRIPSFGRRVAALGVDAGLALAFTLWAIPAWPWLDARPSSWDPDVWIPSLFDGPLLAAVMSGLVTASLITGIAHGLFGRSPGKLLLGLRLIRTSPGAVPSVGWAVGRAILSLLSLAALGAGYAWVVVDRRCRTWHDLLSGSVVVKTRASSEGAGSG